THTGLKDRTRRCLERRCTGDLKFYNARKETSLVVVVYCVFVTLVFLASTPVTVVGLTTTARNETSSNKAYACPTVYHHDGSPSSSPCADKCTTPTVINKRTSSKA